MIADTLCAISGWNSAEESKSGRSGEQRNLGAEPGLGTLWLTHPVRGVVFSARMVCRKASGRRKDIAVFTVGCCQTRGRRTEIFGWLFLVAELERVRLGAISHLHRRG
jgi:hypothetical protein